MSFKTFYPIFSKQKLPTNDSEITITVLRSSNEDASLFFLSGFKESSNCHEL